MKPISIAATIDLHLKTCNSDMGQTLRENINVDNVITGTSSVQDAINLYNFGKKLLKTAA